MEIKNPHRILHVIGRMDYAGAETLLMNLYREVDRSKFQFDFVYFTNERCDFDDEIDGLGGVVVRIEGGNRVSRVLRLWSVMCRGSWRTVHAHTFLSSGLFLLAAKLAGVPRRVVHSHNTSDENSSSWSGRAYQRCMRWLLSWVPTDYVSCGTAAGAYLFPGRSDVQLIPNAIDISRFLVDVGGINRLCLNLPPSGLIILQVGRLMPVKNHTLSVMIAAALLRAEVDFQMLFVGTGPEHQAIENLIQQHKLQNRVRLLGLREDISKLMSAADIMLMPSLYEGFPVVLVESQAAGLPAVISSNISTEVDLGLGLVKFIDVDALPEMWVASILATAQTGPVAIETRTRVLEASGFSASAAAARLTAIYNTS